MPVASLTPPPPLVKWDVEVEDVEGPLVAFGVDPPTPRAGVDERVLFVDGSADLRTIVPRSQLELGFDIIAMSFFVGG